MKLYKSNNIIVVDYKKQEQEESKKIDSLHHIHLLDRSWSMSRNIENLIENVKSTLNVMHENDYVSIIWFSSEGQYKTIIKGAKRNDGLSDLLDSIKSCLGCTCFSESLKEVGEIINDLGAICSNFNVTLFTDGEAVTSWSDEEDRSLREVDIWKDKALALNTVGYGNYYNQEFLKQLSDKTNYGKMMHSSQIDEYMNIWSSNFERISDLALESVEIVSNGSDILYLSNKDTKLEVDIMQLRALDNKKNTFVIFDFKDSIVIDGEVYETADITAKISKPLMRNIMYAYAYELYYKNDRYKALNILASDLKDKYLVDAQINAFTFDEVSSYTHELKKAVFSNKHRLLEGECEEGYLPADDATCLMDIMNILSDGESYYIYNQSYNRIGKKITDTYNLFKRNEGEVITRIDDFTFNKDKLNISIRSLIRGKVQINPQQADNYNLPHEFDSSMFRAQTIIKDGSLNMKTMNVVVDYETLNKLMALNVQGLINNVQKHEKGNKVELDLSIIPVINRTYVRTSTDEVCKKVKKELELSARQKVLNGLLKNLSSSEKHDLYSPEQLKVLKEHGLDPSMLYVGVKNKVEESEDFYIAKNFSFKIKGAASLPSLNKVIEKSEAGKKMNAIEKMMYDYMLLLSDIDNDIEALKKELKKVKDMLLKIRLEIFSVKIGKVLTGDWFEDVELDDKGSFVFEDMIIKADRKKVYF